ncbi:hypothetical protein [Lysobacter enzymogenes]|uniref:hypothetical protein n=1 Tax=Lysobacter enzymogenes TaxID=69 RepID=UPI001A976E03|nr:hypothetical protein [Lysobacter enzymogenes]QQP97241.1 hypothetical protein JHW38_04110 [Lysobacter enzymogenes]
MHTDDRRNRARLLHCAAALRPPDLANASVRRCTATRVCGVQANARPASARESMMKCSAVQRRAPCPAVAAGRRRFSTRPA